MENYRESLWNAGTIKQCYFVSSSTIINACNPPYSTVRWTGAMYTKLQTAFDTYFSEGFCDLEVDCNQ